MHYVYSPSATLARNLEPAEKPIITPNAIVIAQTELLDMKPRDNFL